METNMPLAISTDYAGDFPEIEKIEHSLQKIAEHGFSHVHWCFDWDGDYIYAKSEIEQIGVWLEKYHLKCKGIHASKGSARFANQTIWHYKKDYTSSIESSRLAGTDLIRNRVDLARRLNCHELVLHMYLPFLDFSDAGAKERFYENSLRSLDELEPYCRENEVKICIENLFEAPADLQLEQFNILTNRYSPDYLGLCIDTGHANLVWGEKVHGSIGSAVQRSYFCGAYPRQSRTRKGERVWRCPCGSGGRRDPLGKVHGSAPAQRIRTAVGTGTEQAGGRRRG